jgi:imidazolonepropionase-like amidohydrolase
MRALMARPSIARLLLAPPLLAMLLATVAAAQDLAVRAELLRTMEGEPIRDGVVLVQGGKITAVGRADAVTIPPGVRELRAAVVLPGLIDAHTCVGLSGYLNQSTDQDQLDGGAPIQPELRAIDAYNARERLIEWVRGFGVTTLHTGHGPGALISGQTMVVKTRGDSVEQAVLVPREALACTLGPSAYAQGERKSPGTAGKEVAMLREQLLKAQQYRDRRAAGGDKTPDRDLRLEALADALDGKLPLMITAHRHQDISSALRLQREFGFKLWLDGAAESYLLLDEIKAAGVPVIVHPAMTRAVEEAQNLSFETAGKLHAAGIPIALQSGYEDYVPKTRVVLYEAGVAAAHGLGAEAALSALTLDAAKLLGLEARIGSLKAGKDGDLALYDGDPLEYTSHCVGTVIDGVLVFEGKR